MRRLFALLGFALFLLTGCAAYSTPASASGSLPKDFLPQAISFWSARSGVMSGVDGVTNTVYLAATADGGRTWTVRLHFPEKNLFTGGTFVTTADHGRGWFTYETCIKTGGYPYADCSIHAMQTINGGENWVRGGPQSLSFSFIGRQGWAIVPRGIRFSMASLYRLTAASSGTNLHRTQVAAPCTNQALGEVASLGGRRAVLVCLGQWGMRPPETTTQAKAFYETTDGGRTWNKILSVPSTATRSVGGLSAAGVPDGLTFLPGGHGWLWEFRDALYATSDGGKTWTFAPLVTDLELEEALSVSFVTDRIGYALLQLRPGGPLVSLMETTNGGGTWHPVTGWTPPPARH